jgi:predicted nucleic-acid-binding Zn-ribbon protein
MRIIEPEKEAFCTRCGTHMMYTQKDILYSYYVDDWRYKTTKEIQGYVNCPKCHNDQYIGIFEYTNLTKEQFREKYKGHIYGEILD